MERRTGMIKNYSTYIKESKNFAFIPFELREKFDPDLKDKIKDKDYRDIKLEHNIEYIKEIASKLNGRKITFTNYNYILNGGEEIVMIVNRPEINGPGILCLRGYIEKYQWHNAFVVVDERKEIIYKDNRIISEEDPYGEEDWEN